MKTAEQIKGSKAGTKIGAGSRPTNITERHRPLGRTLVASLKVRTHQLCETEVQDHPPKKRKGNRRNEKRIYNREYKERIKMNRRQKKYILEIIEEVEKESYL